MTVTTEKTDGKKTEPIVCSSCNQPEGVLVNTGFGWVHVNAERCLQNKRESQTGTLV